jgi:hypothetical protein
MNIDTFFSTSKLTTISSSSTIRPPLPALVGFGNDNQTQSIFTSSTPPNSQAITTDMNIQSPSTVKVVTSKVVKVINFNSPSSSSSPPSLSSTPPNQKPKKKRKAAISELIVSEEVHDLEEVVIAMRELSCEKICMKMEKDVPGFYKIVIAGSKRADVDMAYKKLNSLIESVKKNPSKIIHLVHWKLPKRKMLPSICAKNNCRVNTHPTMGLNTLLYPDTMIQISISGHNSIEVERASSNVLEFSQKTMNENELRMIHPVQYSMIVCNSGFVFSFKGGSIKEFEHENSISIVVEKNHFEGDRVNIFGEEEIFVLQAVKSLKELVKEAAIRISCRKRNYNRNRRRRGKVSSKTSFHRIVRSRELIERETELGRAAAAAQVLCDSLNILMPTVNALLIYDRSDFILNETDCFIEGKLRKFYV